MKRGRGNKKESKKKRWRRGRERKEKRSNPSTCQSVRYVGSGSIARSSVVRKQRGTLAGTCTHHYFAASSLRYESGTRGETEKQRERRRVTNNHCARSVCARVPVRSYESERRATVTSVPSTGKTWPYPRVDKKMILRALKHRRAYVDRDPRAAVCCRRH